MTSAVTVVVPTRAPGRSLRRTLEGLADQVDPGVPWEVLVVVNAERTTSLEDAALPVLPVRVRGVHEPEPGASAARNRGVREVRTPLVAFLDDDARPEARWLGSLVGTMREGGFDGVGGKVLLDPDVNLPRWMDDVVAGYLTQLDLGPATRPLQRGEYVLTANALFRTDLVGLLGFDPLLGPGPAAHLTNDDLDLTARALAHGASVGWAPDAVVVHEVPNERLRLGWLLRRAFTQGRSDLRLAYPEGVGRGLRGLHRALRPGFGIRSESTARRSQAVVRVLVSLSRTVGWWWESARSWPPA